MHYNLFIYLQQIDCQTVTEYYEVEKIQELVTA